MDSARRRWIKFGCAAAWAVWVCLGQGGAAPDAPAGRDVLTVLPAQAGGGPAPGEYATYCAACHQANGQGMPGAFPSLVNDPIVNGDPHYLARVVLYGLQGRIVVNGKPYSSAMSGFADKMNDVQMADLLTYIRSSWGNKAAEVSPDVVKAERAIPGTPQDNVTKYPK